MTKKDTMTIIDQKLDELRALLEKLDGVELAKVLYEMRQVIAKVDNTRLFAKVFDNLAEQLRTGEVKFPSPKPINVESLINAADGVMIDDVDSKIERDDNSKHVVMINNQGVCYSFSKVELSNMRLNDGWVKIKDMGGLERTVMFYKRVPVEREDLAV